MRACACSVPKCSFNGNATVCTAIVKGTRQGIKLGSMLCTCVGLLLSISAASLTPSLLSRFAAWHYDVVNVCPKPDPFRR
jgi:uncharacterized membrane-anchored protein